MPLPEAAPRERGDALVESDGAVQAALDEGRALQTTPGLCGGQHTQVDQRLDKHDRHQVRAKTDITCVCVFNPPVTGREVHDENGVYPLIIEEGETQ